MKSVLKVAGMRKSSDVRKVQSAIAINEGVIASEVALDKNEVTIIYNDVVTELDEIIDKIEDMGYTVI
ncbi:MAG: heavy-metal-associated domain-containing protein [Clostridium sp.]|uniref:heavy-metal-associated domain-containing protein n=1 Tax=Clostridium sp. TaxID=1506 RepID=UPI003F3F35C8